MFKSTSCQDLVDSIFHYRLVKSRRVLFLLPRFYSLTEAVFKGCSTISAVVKAMYGVFKNFSLEISRRASTKIHE